MHMTWTDRRGGPAARLLAVALLLLAAACAGGDEAPKAADLPAGVSPLAADARMAMPAAERSACQPASTRKVFRMDAEWNGFWEYGFAAGCPRPQLPPGFDWNKEMIILTAMGRRESPADSIQVRGSGVVGDSVLAHHTPGRLRGAAGARLPPRPGPHPGRHPPRPLCRGAAQAALS
jgi:hypothetical protein